MSTLTSKSLSIEEIRTLEQHAHELRAQAMAEMTRTLGRAIARGVSKIGAAMYRPRHTLDWNA